MTSVKDFQKRVAELLEKLDWGSKNTENKYYTIIHAIEELGELSREILHAEEKTRPDKNGKAHTIEDLKGELCDVFYHCFKIAELYEIDLESAFEKKMNELEQRFLKKQSKNLNNNF